jgi:hypothetical protein
MANKEQLSILKQGVDVWNKWRDNNPDEYIDLTEAEISNANLSRVDLGGVNLKGALLKGADLSDSNLGQADLSEADLSGANLLQAELSQANLHKAKLNNANLHGAYLWGANLSEADLSRANLAFAVLMRANLTKANLTNAELSAATLIHTTVSRAKVSGSSIYAINVWDLIGEFEDQKDLVISARGRPGMEDAPEAEPSITVDNIKVAQFIYLILNNEEIRNAINTLTSKSVLILGRFAIPERKAILDALRNKLREYDLLPIVFDFDRPTDKDFTETIKTLAGLSYFVIADVTNPKSSPLELQATVPDYQIPFVPIIQEGEKPFAMMVDLQKKYNWVLNTVSYDSEETLMSVVKPLIIDPAMKKRQELRIIKAQEPEIISAKDFLAKGKE